MHCAAGTRRAMVQRMKRERKDNSKIWAACAMLATCVIMPNRALAEPGAAAVVAYNSYISAVESRLARQHQSMNGYLAQADWMRLRQGERIVEEMSRAGGKPLPDALLHDWRGTAFVPGARAVDFERVMRDFADYPHRYGPQVESARVLSHNGDHYQVKMRVRQQQILTVVMDTTYDVTFGRQDANRGYSISRSTRIAEIDAPDTARERPSEDHGFLWRLNTYWSYEERDGGLYVQIESVSLTRSIPIGLVWAITPFLETVPRESLEFTLRSTCNALRG